MLGIYTVGTFQSPTSSNTFFSSPATCSGILVAVGYVVAAVGKCWGLVRKIFTGWFGNAREAKLDGKLLATFTGVR